MVRGVNGVSRSRVGRRRPNPRGGPRKDADGRETGSGAL